MNDSSINSFLCDGQNGFAELTNGGLFEGIGGFPLAAEWAGVKPIWSNEIDNFSCNVLRKHFKHKIIEDDIRKCGKHNLQPVDIVSGGFPCQPFSVAGVRKGTSDNRYLWPEMYRIIKELKPKWVLGENVPGLISMPGIYEQICNDLENIGYTVQSFIIPACSVGAWHKRDRLWILAYSEYYGQQRWECKNIKGKIELPKIFFTQYKTGCFHEIEEKLISEPGCIKSYDGLPRRVVKRELIAYGNAIVPQIAYQFYKIIQIADRQMRGEKTINTVKHAHS